MEPSKHGIVLVKILESLPKFVMNTMDG